jgi:hypothetical protein
MVYDALYSEVPANPMAPGPPEAHRATIRIGQLVMEFTVRDAANPVIKAIGGDIANLLITIWPSVEIVSWPPRVAFDEGAWRSFTAPEITEPPA